MATTNQAVTADQLISATVRYTNKDDSARVYDISANVNIQSGAVSSFDMGEIRKGEQEENPMQGANVIATFSSYNPRQLNVYFNDADSDEAKSILESIYSFMDDVKTNVNANPVTA